MNDNELKKVDFGSKCFLEMLCLYRDKNYDFGRLGLTEEELLNNLNGDWTLEIRELKKEQVRQDSILLDAYCWCCEKYVDTLLDNEYKAEIRNYGKCYLVESEHSSFGKIYFLFDKIGHILHAIEENEGKIVGIDDNNFWISKKGKFQERDIYLYNWQGKKIKLVNWFENVIADFSMFSHCDDNSLITSFMRGDVDRFIYNYKNRKIMVPSYSFASDKLGEFSKKDIRGDYVRIVKSINFVSKSIQLEFLIDREGRLITDIYDFFNGVVYKRDDYEGTQVELLDSIYREVLENLKEILQVNKVSKVKCKQRILPRFR